MKLSYSDFLLAPSVRRVVTMECAGNPSGGSAVSTAAWSGIPLGDLLRKTGIQPEATTVVLHGADSGDGDEVPPGTHFARAIPLDKAMDEATLLAYEMNGLPLPADHGFPVRALVSGWYGMDSVKWLTRVEVLTGPFDGYFQEKSYAATNDRGERRILTSMNINSKFLRPSNDEVIHAKSYRIEGVAWAGDQKVSRVELRFDPSGPWQPATLSTSPETRVWTPWFYEWHVSQTGQYTLEVRAIDDKGMGQLGTRDPHRKDPYELNLPQRISVSVQP
jgi:DMSO/TMAO reductase YedYZ molybdopterin-dependent catalytic subunit